jgi:hypothetical protein
VASANGQHGATLPWLEASDRSDEHLESESPPTHREDG